MTTTYAVMLLKEPRTWIGQGFVPDLDALCPSLAVVLGFGGKKDGISMSV